LTKAWYRMFQRSLWGAAPSAATEPTASRPTKPMTDGFQGPQDAAIEDEDLWPKKDDVSRRRQQGMHMVRRPSGLRVLKHVTLEPRGCVIARQVSNTNRCRPYSTLECLSSECFRAALDALREMGPPQCKCQALVNDSTTASDATFRISAVLKHSLGRYKLWPCCNCLWV